MFILLFSLSYFYVFCLFPIVSLSETVCEFTVDALVTQILEEQSLDEQSEALVSRVCSEIVDEEDNRRCQRSSRSYWYYLAPFIYELGILNDMDAICSIQHSDVDECAVCGLRVQDMADNLKGNQDAIIALIQGDVYCNMENAWWDIPKCQEEITWYIPRALVVIAEYMIESFAGTEASSFCADPVGAC